VGRKRGLLMILSGESVSAREALDMGLVSRVVPRADLEAETMVLASTLVRLSPAALGLAKQAADTIQGMEYGKSLRYLREMVTLVALSDDAKEGIAAFFEKREPQWKGR
jgi:enoyl-CoA hydratase/carnithine racemase